MRIHLTQLAIKCQRDVKVLPIRLHHLSYSYKSGAHDGLNIPDIGQTRAKLNFLKETSLKDRRYWD